MTLNAISSHSILSALKKSKHVLFCLSVSSILIGVTVQGEVAIADNNLSIHGHELSLTEYKMLIEANSMFVASGHKFSNYSKVFLDRKKDRYVITFLSKFHEPDVFGVRPGLPPDILIVKKDGDSDLKIVPSD